MTADPTPGATADGHARGRARRSGRGGNRTARPGTIAHPDDPRAVDAVHRDAQASYATARAADEVDGRDRAVVSAQLGRPARGEAAVVHRCRWGLPTVVRVGPRLEDGTPFPTTFWLSCPALRSRIGTLEADGSMVELNERLTEEPAFAGAYAAAHGRYVAFRDELGDPLPGEPGAGGMPGRVKCLHVHAAHHLATGDNPVGAWTVEAATPLACAGPCVDVDAVDDVGTADEVAARDDEAAGA